MRLFNFYTTVHMDRFGDLEMLTRGSVVTVEPNAVGSDGTVEIYVKGEAATTLRLDQAIRRLPHLATPVPVVTE